MGKAGLPRAVEQGIPARAVACPLGPLGHSLILSLDGAFSSAVLCFSLERAFLYNCNKTQTGQKHGAPKIGTSVENKTRKENRRWLFWSALLPWPLSSSPGGSPTGTCSRRTEELARTGDLAAKREVSGAITVRSGESLEIQISGTMR